jgi:hypothetical protein
MSDIVDEAKLYQLDDDGNVVDRIRDAGAAWKNFIADHTILMNGIRTLIRNMKTIKKRTAEQFVHGRSTRVEQIRREGAAACGPKPRRTLAVRR